VDVTLLVGAGTVSDPTTCPVSRPSRPHAPAGAGSRGALDIADEAAYLGASLNTGAGFDAATASLHVPKRRLGPALDLLADVVLRPTFPDTEIARQRDLRRAQILQQRDQPVAMANVAFAAIVSAPRTPTGARPAAPKRPRPP